jgi:Ni/Co efflux regulator RcnB
MKRILLSALAVTMLATPALAQPGPGRGHDRDHRSDRYEQSYGGRHDHRGPQKQVKKKRHHWSKGQRVPKEYRRNVDYRRHHLKAPPRGYQWVENDGQYLMIGIATGLIAAIATAGR